MKLQERQQHNKIIIEEKEITRNDRNNRKRQRENTEITGNTKKTRE